MSSLVLPNKPHTDSLRQNDSQFCPAKEFNTQWPDSKGLLSYYNRVVSTYSVSSQISYKQLVSHVKFSRSTGLWTVTILDLTTKQERIETCNVFIGAVGALSTPADPPFDTTNFDGKVMHTAQWDENYDLTGKKVVVLGNGCSAAQVIPVSRRTLLSLFALLSLTFSGLT